MLQAYELKVTIDLPEGMQSIWRQIVIRGEASLVELGDAIQACFGWSGTHKHEFVAADGSWKATNPQYGPPEFDESYQNEEEVRSCQQRFLSHAKGTCGILTRQRQDKIDRMQNKEAPTHHCHWHSAILCTLGELKCVYAIVLKCLITQ